MNYVLTFVCGMLSFLLQQSYRDNKKLRESRKQANLDKEKLRKEKNENMDELTLGIARIMLNNSMLVALNRGYTTLDESKIIYGLYEPYIKSGGNGPVKHLLEDRYETLKVKENIEEDN